MPVRAGTTLEMIASVTCCWEAAASGQEVEAEHAVFIGRGLGIRRQAPMGHQSRAFEDPCDDVGVPDVDDQVTSYSIVLGGLHFRYF